MTAVTEHTPTHAESYRGLVARRILILGGLTVLLLLSLAVDVALGPARYSLPDVLRTVFAPGAAEVQMRVVVWDIRMPMALLAVTVGASLSLAGAQMQTILANPLASPFTLGLSAAASFGAALAMVLGVSLFPAAIALMVPINAFAMAMAASLLIFGLSTLRGVTVETIILLGIALVFSFNAALALLQFFASEQALSAVVFWTMGSLTKATWAKVAVTAAILAVCAPLFARRAWALTAIRLGETPRGGHGRAGQAVAPRIAVSRIVARRRSGLIRRDDRLYRHCRAACGAVVVGRGSTVLFARGDAVGGGDPVRDLGPVQGHPARCGLAHRDYHGSRRCAVFRRAHFDKRT